MYPNNIYVKNYNEIKKLTGDIGVQLDKFDHIHHLKHDDLARAQYKHCLLYTSDAADEL